MGDTICVSKGKECSSEDLMDVVFEEKVIVKNNQSFQTSSLQTETEWCYQC